MPQADEYTGSATGRAFQQQLVGKLQDIFEAGPASVEAGSIMHGGITPLDHGCDPRAENISQALRIDQAALPHRIQYGVGIRYLMARMLGMRLGIDVAWGPEDTAVYLTVGHNWRI